MKYYTKGNGGIKTMAFYVQEPISSKIVIKNKIIQELKIFSYL
jgi:hypothetical protein